MQINAIGFCPCPKGLRVKNNNREYKNTLHNKNMSLSKVFYNPLSFKGQTPSSALVKLSANSCEPEILDEIRNFTREQKEEFVEKYCSMTGFPDFNKVGSKMILHAKRAILESAIEAKTPVLWSGFHAKCSAAYGLALPGSDLDATAMIVDGEQKDIDKFKGELWNRYNPLIVSIRKDYEFPDIYSIEQLYEWTRLVDKIVEEEGLSEKASIYKANLEETKDYFRALEFNIDAAQGISKYSKEELAQMAPSCKALLLEHDESPKNITQSMSSLLESLRSGNTILDYTSSDLSSSELAKMIAIKNSYLYKYGNMCVQDAKYPIKDKLLKRSQLITPERFDAMPSDDKFNLILKMIYESYPSWSKAKIEPDTYAQALFDNGEGVDMNRISAFALATDS